MGVPAAFVRAAPPHTRCGGRGDRRPDAARGLGETRHRARRRRRRRRITVLRLRDQVVDAVRYGFSAANRYSISAISSGENSSVFAPLSVRTTVVLKMPRFFIT